MFHFVYKTTNIVNNKYYIGKHSTNNINDGYLGSGKLLKFAIKKYGIDNFKRDILQFCETDKDALKLEKQLISEDIVKDNNSYNISFGGSGSWCFANIQHNNRHNFRKTGNYGWKKKCDPIKLPKLISDGLKKYYKIHKHQWFDRKHSPETKEKIGIKNSINQKGKRNSQFGKCWVYNNYESKSIPKKELDSYLQTGWKKGRKIKFNNH